MYKYLSKNGQVFALILGGGLAAIAAVTLFSSEGANGFGLAASMGLLIVALAAIVILGLYNAARNPAAAKKGLILFGSLAAFMFILYLTSNGAETGSLAETMNEFEVSEGESKMISGFVKSAIFLSVGAFVSFIVMEIVNIFK